MSEALRTLLAGLIDYAGLFPPAALERPEAARNYAAYRAGPQAWALGRFIVPAARLDEVDPSWPLSVIGMPPRAVECCELKLEDVRGQRRASTRGGDAAGDRDREGAIFPAATVYFELPLTEDPSLLAGSPARAKIRTGGLTPDAFPAPADLARFLARCAAARVPFKATAGLHHPLRSVQRCTYQPDSPTALMHGFLNVFLAAGLLWHGGSESDALATIEEQSPEAFHFDDQAAAWHGHRLTTAQLSDARRHFAISFGSCSFEEPSHDLQQLGWI